MAKQELAGTVFMRIVVMSPETERIVHQWCVAQLESGQVFALEGDADVGRAGATGKLVACDPQWADLSMVIGHLVARALDPENVAGVRDRPVILADAVVHSLGHLKLGDVIDVPLWVSYHDRFPRWAVEAERQGRGSGASGAVAALAGGRTGQVVACLRRDASPKRIWNLRGFGGFGGLFGDGG